VAAVLRLGLVLFILILASTTVRAAVPTGSDGPQADCGNLATIIRPQYRPNTVYVIPVVFHVIMDINGNGYLSDRQILDQVRVLNEDFRAMAGTYGAGGYDTRIRFELEGITRTFNDVWFQCGNELEFKTALGWDQGSYLNIYTNRGWETLSYAYLPADYAGSVWDGVVLYFQSVGGRDQAGREPRDQGRTAVHEIGHYLGLLDTYTGGCANGYESGDLIMDTNPELEPHLACGPSYSCGGLDPVHNYMSGAGDCLPNDLHARTGQPHGLHPAELPAPALPAAKPGRADPAPDRAGEPPFRPFVRLNRHQYGPIYF
jgi:hypothetical protein